MAKAATKAEDKKATAILEVPIADAVEHVYCRRHVNANLNREQAIKLRRIVDGLDASGAKLANGRRVVTVAAAVVWMIEQVKA